MSTKPIGDTELVSRTRIMQAYGLQWDDVEPLLTEANVKPVPLSPKRQQPRYLGSAVRRALESYGQH